MNDNRKTNSRRSTRLKNYDYSQPGYYFVTICTYEKKWLFGEIIDDQMHLNSVGDIVQTVWNTLPKRFPHLALDEYIIMPNHMHGIIVIEATQPYNSTSTIPTDVPERFKRYMNSTWGTFYPTADSAPPHPLGRDKSGPYIQRTPALGEIIRTFKSASTHQIRQTLMPNFSWQNSYYDNIIRRDNDLDHIHQYITTNPAGWSNDSLNIKEGTAS
ncbi:MAG TPA: transposase [Ktedonobacteraceae bacterium]